MSNKTVNSLSFQSAYIDKPEFSPAFEMSLLNDLTMVELRLNPNDKSVISAVESVIDGLSLPFKPFCSSSKKDLSCLWLSNDRWLLVGGRNKNLLSSLKKSLGNISLSYYCDVSGQRSVFRLSGSSVLTSIYKAGFFDVSHSAYGVGYVKRFSFANIPSLLHVISLDASRQVIDIYVMRSYSEYVYRWLCQTGIEGSKITL